MADTVCRGTAGPGRAVGPVAPRGSACGRAGRGGAGRPARPSSQVSQWLFGADVTRTSLSGHKLGRREDRGRRGPQGRRGEGRAIPASASGTKPEPGTRSPVEPVRPARCATRTRAPLLGRRACCKPDASWRRPPRLRQTVGGGRARANQLEPGHLTKGGLRNKTVLLGLPAVQTKKATSNEYF